MHDVNTFSIERGDCRVEASSSMVRVSGARDTRRTIVEHLGCAYAALCVLVESSPALTAEPPGGHVASQERAGSVFGVSEACMQGLHDVEAGIQPDEVG